MRAEANAESTSIVLSNLGIAALRTGDYAEAARRFGGALDLFAKRSAPVGMLEQIQALAAVAAVAGEPPAAARLLGAAEALEEARGIRLEQNILKIRDDAVPRCEPRWGGRPASTLGSRGATTLDEATDQAARLAARLHGSRERSYRA